MKHILKKIHLWLGLTLCIPLTIIGLTGSILVFEDQLSDFYFNKNSIRLAVGDNYRVSDFIEYAQKETKIPQNFVPRIVKMPKEVGYPAIVRFVPSPDRPSGSNQLRFIEVQIDPVSLAIIDVNNSDDNKFIRFIHNLHTNIFIGNIGNNIVGILGLMLLLFGFTGIILWWPEKRNFAQAFTVNFSTHGTRFHRELHGFIGIWFWIVFVIVSFSGVYLVFPNGTHKAISTIFPGQNPKEVELNMKVEPNFENKYLQVNDAVNIARFSFTQDLPLLSITLPIRDNEPYKAIIALDEKKKYVHPAATIFVDPWNPGVIGSLNPQKYSLGESIISWQKLLHTGQAFGLLWKILVFLVGLLPLIFSVTGIYIWANKGKEKQNKNHQHHHKKSKNSITENKHSNSDDDDDSDDSNEGVNKRVHKLDLDKLVPKTKRTYFED